MQFASNQKVRSYKQKTTRGDGAYLLETRLMATLVDIEKFCSFNMLFQFKIQGALCRFLLNKDFIFVVEVTVSVHFFAFFKSVFNFKVPMLMSHFTEWFRCHPLHTFLPANYFLVKNKNSSDQVIINESKQRFSYQNASADTNYGCTTGRVDAVVVKALCVYADISSEQRVPSIVCNSLLHFYESDAYAQEEKK